MSRVFKGFADGEDASVHHVGRGDDLRACVGVAQGLFHQNFDGFVVEDIAVRIGQPVLPVDGVGVEGDIGHDAEFGEFLAQGAHDGRYESFGVVGFFR